MSLEITDSVLEHAKALNAAGDVAGAYRVLAEAGDNYSQNALVVIEEINDPESIFSCIVQTHWNHVAPGERKRLLTTVSKQNQQQHLQLVQDDPGQLNERGECTFYLSNSIAIKDR